MLDDRGRSKKKCHGTLAKDEKTEEEEDEGKWIDGKNKPKNSISGFIFFCQEERPKLKKKHPEMTFGELSSELRKAWAELPDCKKKKYLKLSEEDKKRYASEKSS
jgi:hypothetical protein